MYSLIKLFVVPVDASSALVLLALDQSHRFAARSADCDRCGWHGTPARRGSLRDL